MHKQAHATGIFRIGSAGVSIEQSAEAFDVSSLQKFKRALRIHGGLRHNSLATLTKYRIRFWLSRRMLAMLNFSCVENSGKRPDGSRRPPPFSRHPSFAFCAPAGRAIPRGSRPPFGAVGVGVWWSDDAWSARGGRTG